MKKVNYVILALIAILVISVVSLFRQNVHTSEENAEYRSRIELVSAARHADSVAYAEKLESLRLDYEARLVEMDSSHVVSSGSTSTSKTLVRTVYRDSVKEVYVENTETTAIYEQQIVSLRDSLAKVLAAKDGVEVQYVEKTVHDTVFVYGDSTDSSRVVKEKTRTPSLGRIGIFADGRATYGQGGFGYGVSGGIRYHVIEPLYLQAGVNYDGDLSGMLGAGMEFRF